ncbi:Protein of unknown function [Gryllus bimaculatus]|nr:Protein of unknown function [Gryllus bimaculatus]
MAGGRLVVAPLGSAHALVVVAARRCPPPALSAVPGGAARRVGWRRLRSPGSGEVSARRRPRAVAAGGRERADAAMRARWTSRLADQSSQPPSALRSRPRRARSAADPAVTTVHCSAAAAASFAPIAAVECKGEMRTNLTFADYFF